MANPPVDERVVLRSEISKMTDPVTVLLFAPEAKSDQVEEFRSQVEDLIKANPEKLSQKVYHEGGEVDVKIEPEIDLYPTIVLMDKDGRDHRIRYLGAPSGRMLKAFVSSILMLSNASHNLDETLVQRLKALPENKLQLLTTPQAINCESTIDIVNRFAYASETVTSTITELIQFPEVAEKYHVIDMPKLVSNEDLKYTGAFTLEDGIQILEKRIGDPE